MHAILKTQWAGYMAASHERNSSAQGFESFEFHPGAKSDWLDGNRGARQKRTDGIYTCIDVYALICHGQYFAAWGPSHNFQPHFFEVAPYQRQDLGPKTFDCINVGSEPKVTDEQKRMPIRHTSD